MSKKAVFVFDFPEHCQACPLKSTVRGIQGVTHCCNLAEGMIKLEEGFEKRLDNCPLTELPNLKQEDVFSNVINVRDVLMQNRGYNDCIRELEEKEWKRK